MVIMYGSLRKSLRQHTAKHVDHGGGMSPAPEYAKPDLYMSAFEETGEENNQRTRLGCAYIG